ncbi:unnamed protein product [Parnassius mnemosyne]|uniref:PiggyBac transposable element-derived protein domain-containing protein n=1 Tax=Parnassius mnemosyne TaxID=213953 RepID=A0AAV1LXS3_9NEOP
MESTRRHVLRDEDVSNLLNNSEIEDFALSDEDLDDHDPPFRLELDHLSSSSDSERSEPETIHEERIVQLAPSRARRGFTRGRSNRGRSSNITSSASDSKILLPSWSEKLFPSKEMELSQPTYLPLNSDFFEKLTYFEQYIDDKFIQLLVERTNQTSVKLHGRSMNLDMKEFYVYLGITFVMASVNYPVIRMYWESKWRMAIIADNMSRYRFIQIRNSIKFVFDDDVSQAERAEDKLWKIRPLIQRIQEGCRVQEKEKHMSLDEMIVPFSGACGIKQYCPGKPNPVGMKAFVLANPSGIVTDFHIYQGSTTYKELEDSNHGLGEKAVITLANTLVPGHILYFDRYFTSVKLANELLKRGIGCTGTIMKNRIPAAARLVLKDDKELQRRGRGSVQTIVSDDNQIAITKWYDNKPVILLSTVEAKEPVDVCQRWCKKQRHYVTVNRPSVVRNYNKYMGGVDLADRMLAVCPNRYRTKKWTQRFFSHMMDLAVSNSWLQFKRDQIDKGVPLKKIQQLRFFKLDLGEKIIEMYTNEETVSADSEEEVNAPTKRKKGKPTLPLPSMKRRQQAAKHMPLFENKQARCRHCHYNKSRTKCSTCNVSLCFTKYRNCYKEFHE